LANSNQFDEQKSKAKGTPAEWAVAALAMLASGQKEMALKLALKVWNEAPDDQEAAIMAAEVLSGDVPDWHFRLVRDRVRNQMYEAALQRTVKPGMRVLDIGSGTGLLAMMAARAGAAEVFSCEMNPAVADAAREVVAANGLADRVKVLGKHSNTLDANADLGGRVDIIVSEIVSSSLLGEEVLTTMEYAVNNLLKPDGRVIPATGAVRVALAFDPNFWIQRMGMVEGFDLTAFNRLAEPRYTVSAKSKELLVMSDMAEMFKFDFHSSAPTLNERTELMLTAHGGSANCIAQWLRLEMDEVEDYENAPGEKDFSSWAIVLHPLPRQVELKAGDAVTVHGAHDRGAVRIWASV
jgi:predicted nicotinamide N-methyase